MHLVEACEQVRPHLVVLGNAAHSLHPIAGQGFNLSLRDTLALVDALLHDDAPLGEFAVLQRYLDGQRLDQQMTVGFSDRVTRLFSNDRALLGAGRFAEGLFRALELGAGHGGLGLGLLQFGFVVERGRRCAG